MKQLTKAAQRETLSKLISNRESNINKVLRWPVEDISEMIGLFDKAIQVATMTKDAMFLSITREKRSQLEAALLKKGE